MKSYYLKDASYFCGGSCQRKCITLPACAGRCGCVCGKGGVFYSGRTLYPSADAFPAQNSCSWDEGHQDKMEFAPQENMGRAIEMSGVSVLHF